MIAFFRCILKSYFSAPVGEYIGETKKRVLTQSIEHQEDSMKEKWEASGATEHSKDCHGQFKWLSPKISII